MNKNDVHLLQKWFKGFTSSFHQKDPDQQRNIALKVEHTGRVGSNIRAIAKSENLEGELILLAETVALFHDVGRFPQYHRFATFKDSESINHGELGADILIRAKALDNLTANEQDVVIGAVRFHNAYRIPPDATSESALFLKLLRDADKLDIWRLFAGFYQLPHERRASEVSLGIPDLPHCSPEVLTALVEGELVQLSAVKTLNDLKLLQLSWVYDLNFASSFAMLRQKNHIDLLAAGLPPRSDVQAAVKTVKNL